MIDAGARFSLGINYVARSPWDALDIDAVRTDFGRVADIGMDLVRLHLTWSQFQPAAARIDSQSLSALHEVLDVADASRLSVIVVLSGLRCGLPPWARGDYYSGALLQAQERYATALAHRVGGHPALRAWDIGDDFATLRAPRAGSVNAGEHASEPASERTVAAWARRVADAVRAASSRPITAGAVARDLTTDRNVRLGSISDALDFISVGGSTFDLPFARNARDADAVAFLAMLAAVFAHRRALASDIGTPTCPPGKFSAYDRAPEPVEMLEIGDDDPVFAPYPCMTPDEQAAYARAVIERLHADGRLGAVWSELYDDATQARGLLYADGSDKPVAAVLRTIAVQARTVVDADDLPAIAAAFYYRTLPASLRTLYDAFLPHVAMRRSTSTTTRD